MQTAYNAQTGEYLGLIDGAWQPLKTASDGKGNVVYLDAAAGTWLPIASGAADTSTAVSASSPPLAPASAADTGGGVGRSLGLGARATLEGLGDILGMATRPVAGALNWANAKLGGSPTYFGDGDYGKLAADALGLPTPEKGGESVASGAVRGAANVVPFLAVAGLPAAPAAVRAFGAMPAAQLASGAAAGGAASAVEQGGGGAGAQLGAALAAGALPLGLAPAVRAGWNTAKNTAGLLDRLTDSGQQRAAGDMLRRFAVDADAAIKRLEAGRGVLLQGSDPTLAQVTGDRGLAILEKGLANANAEGRAAELAERYIAQDNARRDATTALLQPAKERIDARLAAGGDDLEKLAPGWQREADALGEDIREAFDAGYAAKKAQVRGAYKAIDPKQSTAFDLRPLQEMFAEAIGPGEMQKLPDDVAGILRFVGEKIKNGENVSYATLQNIRSVLSDAAVGAAKDMKNSQARIANGMKKAIDNYLERGAMAAELQGAAPVAQPGSRTYREATQLARGAVSENAWLDDLQSIIERGGLNQEAVEKLVGKAGVEELRRLNPGVVRKNGPLMPDSVARELPSFQGFKGGGVDDMYPDDFLQELMARLGGNMGGKRRAVDTLREGALEGITPGHTGFTPEQAEAFRVARDLRRQQGEMFEQGANKKLALRGDELGGEKIADSAIPRNYFKTPEAVRAFNLAMQDSDSARRALLDYAVGEALRKSAGKDGNVNPAKLAKWLEQNRGAVNELSTMRQYPFDLPFADATQANQQALLETLQNTIARQNEAYNQLAALKRVGRLDQSDNWVMKQAKGRYPDASGAGLSDAELAQLDAIRADMQRAYNTQRIASVAGSPTAQLQRIEQEIQQMMDRLPGAKSNAVGKMLLAMLDGMMGDARSNIYGHLTRSVLYPADALRLLRGAGSTSMNPWNRFAARPTQTTWQTLKDSRAPHILNMTRALMAPQGGNTNRRTR